MRVERCTSASVCFFFDATQLPFVVAFDKWNACCMDCVWFDAGAVRAGGLLSDEHNTTTISPNVHSISSAPS